jgi:hypothetical protein
MKTLNFQSLLDYVAQNGASEYPLYALKESIYRSFENEPSVAFIDSLDTAGLIVQAAEVSQTAFFNWEAYVTWQSNNLSVNQIILQLMSDAATVFTQNRTTTAFLRQFLGSAGFLIIE